jgi:predicted metal-dependent hydrolase
MKVRQPSLDFTGLDAHWAANTEAVRMLNAVGIVPAHIEPFLIKVMRLARAELDPQRHRDLIDDIDVLIRQEGQHTKFHAACNRAMRAAGYEMMAELEAAYAADYEVMLREKSLRYNLAYCEGFEATGSAAASTFLDDGFEEQLGACDPRPLELWRWHLAEEYEHRTVVFRTYHALYGRNPVVAYVYRLYGFFSFTRHLGGHVRRWSEAFAAADEAAGRQGAQSRARPSGPRRRGVPGGTSLTKMLSVLSPFYDPARIPPPKHLEAVLAKY